jgi:hypothetical protein
MERSERNKKLALADAIDAITNHADILGNSRAKGKDYGESGHLTSSPPPSTPPDDDI